jgi:hypothetical protein
MKRLFTLILILFCFINAEKAKAQIIWERIEKDTVTYRDEYTKVIVKDSLMYLSGLGSWKSVWNFKTFFSCYNFNGKLKWRKNGRDFSRDYGYDFILDSDSLLLTYRFNQNFKLDWLRTRMSTGDTLSPVQFTVPYSFWTIANGYIVKEPNGSYMIGGEGPTLSRMNKTGIPVYTNRHIWYNSTSNTGDFEPNGFLLKSNGNYIMGGSQTMVINNVYASHSMLIEFKPNGDTLKTRTFILEHPQNYEDAIYSNLIQTRKGDILFCGRIDTIINNNSFDGKYFVTKTDEQFNLKWIYFNKGVLRNYLIDKVFELADSSFVVQASIRNGSTGNYALINISKNGTYLSHKIYSNAFCNGLPMLFGCAILPDGTVIVAGKCKNHGYSYLARVTGFGPPAKVITVKPGFDGIPEVVPLPKDEVPIETVIPEISKTPADLYIYDLTGRIVKKLVVTETDIAKISIDFTGYRISNGIYIYKLISQDGNVSTRKVLLLR